jgi:hypothetical protein
VDPSIASREKFEAARVANGLSDADLAGILDRTHKIFWLYMAIAACSLLVGAWSVHSYPLPEGWGLFMVFGRFVATPAALALALRPGYLNWITRHRDLRGLTAYLTSGDCLPKAS